MSKKLKRHRPDIMVVGEGKAMSVMPEDPMGVWCHIQDVHDLLAEKDAEIESLKASHYAEMVDAGMSERRLRRALYKALANWAKSERYTEATWHGDEHREELWAEVQNKCLKKAEEFR